MENFGAEVGELGGFGEGDAFDAMAAGEHGGVAGEHAVDVGPDLDLLGADARADDGGGEVRTAAAERGGDAVFGGGDEAAHYDDVFSGERRDDCGEAGVGFRVERSGLGVAAVGDDQLARVGMDGGQAVRLEEADDDEAGEALAEAGDGVDGARGQLAENREAADEFGEFLEMFFDGALHAGFAEMKIAQIVEQRESGVAMAGDGGAGDFEQLVGGFAHRGDDDDGMAGEAGFDDGGDAFDGGGGLDGGAAELHDDHRSSRPSESMSSALRTAAPAAPRTVLWPRATNL